MALATDFPRLWNDPHTPQRERKRMARLLIADVTLLKSSEVRAQLRFKGGATHTLTLPLPKSAWMLRQTPETVVTEISRLLDDHTEGEIADLLNSKGMISGEGKRFNRTMVARIRSNYDLEARYSRLQARGMLTLAEMQSVRVSPRQRLNFACRSANIAPLQREEKPCSSSPARRSEPSRRHSQRQHDRQTAGGLASSIVGQEETIRCDRAGISVRADA
jgi:hypothetical protein